MHFIHIKYFKKFLIYVDWWTKTPFRKYSIWRPRQNFVFPRSFISNSFFKYFAVLMSSSGVPTRFKSSTYTSIITNSISDFLMKMHGHIGLFTYPSFSKYSLRWLYHMRPDCFNIYKDRCNFIEYMLWGFLIFASDNLNPSRIFMYVSLSIIHINML